MHILFVLTSHDQLGNTGRKTGFWLEELANPFYALKDKGVKLTLASPKGGHPPIDPTSTEESFLTEATRRFSHDAIAQAQLAATVELSAVDAADYDAVFSQAAMAHCGISRRTWTRYGRSRTFG